VNISTETLHLRHLVKDILYRLEMSAFSKMGEGIRSDVIYIGTTLFNVNDNYYHFYCAAITLTPRLSLKKNVHVFRVRGVCFCFWQLLFNCNCFDKSIQGGLMVIRMNYSLFNSLG